MIALASDCLVFQMPSGESVPFYAESISIEFAGLASDFVDDELVKQSAHAVFHYFKYDLGRRTITVGEFAGALERVLRGFTLHADSKPTGKGKAALFRADLRKIALESGKGCELFFFPLLRDEVRQQLRQAQPIIRFTGLRSCVKQLVGARRWGLRCQVLRDQIVEYLGRCVCAEGDGAGFSLVVEC